MISKIHILSVFTVFWSSLACVADEQDAVIHQPRKYGLLDAEGNVISACQWDSAGEFYNGATVVEKDGKTGLLDSQGRLVIPCVWDDVRWFFHENRAAVRLDGKMGYIDRTGKVAIKLEWDWCGEFRGNIAEVERDDRYGLIDVNGNVVVKPEWDEIRFTEHFVMCVKDKKILLMDNKGKILNLTLWDKVTIYSDGLLAGEKDRKTTFLDANGEVIVDEVLWIGHDRNQFEKYEIFSIHKEEGWGYISRTGELQSMPQWDNEIFFDKDHVVVTKNGVEHILYRSGRQVAVPGYNILGINDGIWSVRDKKTEKIGYMDASLKLVIPCEWDNGSRVASSGRIVVERDGMFGALDYKGEVVIPIEWQELDDFSEGEPAIAGKNGVYGFIDRNGKLITKVEYDDCSCFRQGLGVGVKGKKSWFIDINGKAIVELNGVVVHDGKGYFIYKNGKVGALDLKGNQITPAVWDNLDWSENGTHVVVKKQNLRGLILSDGQIVTPAQWDEIVGFGHNGDSKSNLYWVKKGEKWGVIDEKGNILHKPIWLKHDPCDKQLAGCDDDPELTAKLSTNKGYVVTNELGKQGYVSAEGKLTIPAIYRELYFVGDQGYALKGALTGFIHKSGKVISECQWDDFYELSEGIFVVQAAPTKKEDK